MPEPGRTLATVPFGVLQAMIVRAAPRIREPKFTRALRKELAGQGFSPDAAASFVELVRVCVRPGSVLDAPNLPHVH